jgi:hypothetical protein
MGPIRGPLMLFPFGLLALWLGWGWRTRKSWWLTLALGAIIGALGFLVRVSVLSVLVGENLWVLITTAAASLLERLPGLKMITGDSRPSQVFIWGNPSSPTVPEVRVYGAFVGLDPQKRFEEIVNALEPVFNVAESNSVYEGSIKVEPTLPRISLNGFPLLTPPTVLVITNDVAPYLLVGAARPVLSSNRPPAELLQQVERPGVVYYQWEITGETLRNLTALDQVRDMLARQRAFIRSGVLRWVQAVAALTELNSVTEASITGDREVTVTRKAPVGLTALELVAVARWLGEDAPLDRSRRTGPPAPAPRNR